jgi:hypothetical protein
MALPAVLANIIGWLRAGYPEGVPQHDYFPFFALLGSQLTEDDVTAIAEELASESEPESAAAIQHAISAVTTNDHPDDADVARVRARLAAGGWPLAPVRTELPGAVSPAWHSAFRAATHQAGLALPSHAPPYQGISRPSRVKVPVGPPFGMVTAHTTLAAPWAAVRPPPPLVPSCVVQPGHTALTRMPSR